MKLNILSILLLIFISSCSQKNNFPEKKSNKLPLSELGLETNVTNVQHHEIVVNKEILSLCELVRQYENRNVNFTLLELESAWERIEAHNNCTNWNNNDSVAWVECTGLLLELTANTKYAKVLENISLNASNQIEQSITPYILTKQIDHIYVNLFEPVEINYQHSMKGEVKIRQETDYPKSGSVQLYFGMTERRHIELFIRIPSWAEGTTVTVKHVKYFAAPGTYCKIVKKWKEGDLVEIEFPMEKIPY